MRENKPIERKPEKPNPSKEKLSNSPSPTANLLLTELGSGHFFELMTPSSSWIQKIKIKKQDLKAYIRPSLYAKLKQEGRRFNQNGKIHHCEQKRTIQVTTTSVRIWVFNDIFKWK